MSETHRMSATGIHGDSINIDFAFEVHKDIDVNYAETMWNNFIKYVKWKRNRQSEQIRKLVRQTFHREIKK